MNSDDDFLREIQRDFTHADTLQKIDRYADWLQSRGQTAREEFARLFAEQRRDPGRKGDLIKQDRRLKELRDQLGDAWCDMLCGYTAASNLSVAQCYGELLGRLDAFTVLSQSSADQLDYAAELWHRHAVDDDRYMTYFSTIFDTSELEIVEMKHWEETVRKRLGDWLAVCIDLYSGRRRRSDSIDEDLLLSEFLRLFQSITQPTSVCKVVAKQIRRDKPIPRSFLFEGPEYVLALTVTIVED